jgi:hypothetical protein
MSLFDILPVAGELVIFAGIVGIFLIICTLGVIGLLVVKMFKRK